MNFAYGILAHAGADQLGLLIDRLADGPEGDRILLHIDQKSDLWRGQRDRFATHPSGKLVLLPDPERVAWADQSLVAAQCRLLREALAHPFDYFHLISGSDWPIAARDRIAADIASFGARRPAFADCCEGRQEERMQHWWLADRGPWLKRFPRLLANVDHAQRRLSRTFSRLSQKAGFERSRYEGRPWAKGSGWFSLPRDIAVDVHAEVSRMLARGRLRFTRCSDEHAVQTVLLRHFGDRIAPDRRYIDWSAGQAHPKLLTRDDLEAIVESGAWFARKFDSAVDAFFLAPDAFAPQKRDSLGVSQERATARQLG